MKSMIALLFSFLALVPLALSVPAVDVDGRVNALEQHVKMLTLAQKLKALEEQDVDEKFFKHINRGFGKVGNAINRGIHGAGRRLGIFGPYRG